MLIINLNGSNRNTIDPDTGKVYEDRTTGIQHSPEFYAYLLKYVNNDKTSK